MKKIALAVVVSLFSTMAVAEMNGSTGVTDTGTRSPATDQRTPEERQEQQQAIDSRRMDAESAAQSSNDSRRVQRTEERTTTTTSPQ